jgi:hypothetical protein
MEIELTLESGLVCDFTPDFRLPNSCDTEKIQWKFQHGKHSHLVANVFDEPPDEGVPTERVHPDL